MNAFKSAASRFIDRKKTDKRAAKARQTHENASSPPPQAGHSLSARTNEMRKDQRNVSHLPHTHCSSLADAPCSPALCSKTSTYRIGRRRDATEYIAAAKKKSKKRFLQLTETDEREAPRERHIMKKEKIEEKNGTRAKSSGDPSDDVKHDYRLFTNYYCSFCMKSILYFSLFSFRYFRST